MKVGVLALQGDVREHERALDALGATPVRVKRAEELDAVQALIIPGGESTTIGKLLDRFELLQPLNDKVADGMPVYGTCAGLILMAHTVVGKEEAPHRVGALDVDIRRNAYGRQVESFEADLEVEGLDSAFRAVFIRAPLIERAGDDVSIIATYDGHPVLVKQDRLLASSFHPEMTGDHRIHQMFLDMVSG
ncbi:MAG: pyridoxal 5-phosphate synthase pdxT subunit [Actinomycetota bacterium]|jgi:5'-phosphate synthase pdxT subunit|nr:pyridoxal 5-phosphate synthase pdxT subunit [Actinomycetota bacterium]